MMQMMEKQTKIMTQERERNKPLNYDMLGKDSLNVLTLFTDYLLDTDTSVYEFFDGVIYNQVVRTKNKQSTVEIISSEDFMSKIKNDKNFWEKVDVNFIKWEKWR